MPGIAGGAAGKSKAVVSDQAPPKQGMLWTAPVPLWQSPVGQSFVHSLKTVYKCPENAQQFPCPMQKFMQTVYRAFCAHSPSIDPGSLERLQAPLFQSQGPAHRR